MDQLRQDVGPMVERITKVITSFRNFRLTMQEYVCLKVVAMLSNAEGKSPWPVLNGAETKVSDLFRKRSRQRTGADPQPLHELSANLH